MKPVKVSDFSKDHWSLLGYIESRVHDFTVAPNTGELNPDNLRINEKKHSQYAAGIRRIQSPRKWKENYGTRLKGFWKDDTVDESKRLRNHDDIDCMMDLETAGIIEIISLINFYVRLTPLGIKVTSELRQWKNDGKNYADFTM